MNNNHFYKDKPLFGMDISGESIKVMQIAYFDGSSTVIGYGVTPFNSNAVVDGVITDFESVATSAKKLFSDNLIGTISTRRVVMTIPAARTYTRTMSLPKLAKKDLNEAVRLEAEQYIPMPLGELYMDYSIFKTTADSYELLAVAVPKKIVDSYHALSRILGLEVIAIEPTINAAARLFTHSEASDVPTILVDLGATSSDITVYDKDLLVTGTVPGGGESFTQTIARALKVTHQEAYIIKTKYGLGVSKKQAEITESLQPVLDLLLKELRRSIRYYEERSTGAEHKIGQIVSMGSGASMPGLSDYMTSHLRLPVRLCDPWYKLKFADLQPPNRAEKSMYATVAGLALTTPREVYS